MVKINNIQLNNYRNFKLHQISFDNKSNVIYGNNGSGKTNILESISLLGKGRGFRNATILDLIHKNEENFLIKSEITNNKNKHDVKIYSKHKDNNFKKIVSLNDTVSRESSDYLEKQFSFLFFLPEMERLFMLSPSYRRNFIDKLIFSENKNYNKIINKYKKFLIERNKILQLDQYDVNWINTIENEIAEVGLQIYHLRTNQLEILNKELSFINVTNNYPFNVELKIIDPFYNKDIDKSIYIKTLEKMRGLDSRYGGTKIGPHKSDFVSIIDNEINASKLSTGQQKTLILMILFSQTKYLIDQKNIRPILLFDEICSHLDRVNRKILSEITQQFNIQFFFTGTEKSLFSFMSTNTNFYNISK